RANVLLLEGGYLGVMLIEVALGIVDLLLQKLGGAMGCFFLSFVALAQKEGRDVMCDFLRGLRITGCEGHEKAGEASGLLHVGVDSLDTDGLADQVDTIVHAETLGWKQVVLHDDGLNLAAAEHLLAHGGDAAIETL